MLRRDVFQGIFYICACMMCACVALLNASEDSVDAVMEGYESPQKLFADIKSPNADSKTESSTQKNASNTNAGESKIDPRDMKLPSQPQWIYSTAIIETSFFDGSFRKGLGTLLRNGLYITSADVIYNGRIVPKKIYAKMQDDLNANMMCVASLSIKALDLDSGLALLKVTDYVDSSCQMREQKSYYQDRIYKRFGIDVFASNAIVAKHTEAFYPYLNNAYLFVAQSLKLEKFATYYDYMQKKENVYGFEMERDSYEEFTYGRAFYDKKNVFLGIMSRVGNGHLPVFINRNVIQDFLCEVQEQGIINDSDTAKSCAKLGAKRVRFFASENAMSFY
ncbi:MULTISPECIES: hypothetical protein [Helicobacter]|uniref:Periplasmic protein n=4 Tax=Helicobacter typhlonius TaxID=76936 RepID=A0A0S4PV11_9HELI|nr:MULTISPECIES: hypothetical protein [Helicobacter]CUU40152.1 FIG00712771: Hypothetical protein [Helicobacter typhlonius]